MTSDLRAYARCAARWAARIRDRRWGRQVAVALLGCCVIAAQADTFTVTTLADGGPGSLRQAVAQANTNPGQDTVRFKVTGTIELGSPLDVTDDLRIDGMEQSVTLSGGDRTTLFLLSAPDKTLEIARLTLSRASFSQSSGGAILSRGNLRLVEALLTDNLAPVGGAIYSSGRQLWIINSTFAQNRALSWGGAVAVGPATQAFIVNSTFVGNDAAQFGGTLFQNPIAAGSSYGGSLVLRNSVLSGVSQRGNCSIISNRIVDGGGNLNSDGSCPFSAAQNSANNTHPMLGELAHHGGPTKTFAPLPGSPLVDSGIDALAQGAQGSGLMTDQRGYRRIMGQHVDRGAFEVQPRERTAGIRDSGEAVETR